MSNPFPPLWRRGVYEAIYRCHDVQRFLPRQVADKVLRRILRAAHQAGPVGLMQPWSFLVIKDSKMKSQVQHEYARAAGEGERALENERRRLARTLIAEAIDHAPVNLVVTCDRSRRGPPAPGPQALLDPDVFVTCRAIQNLWLAARAEGVGVGWVNDLDPSAAARILGLPSGVMIVAYLCLGYVARFTETLDPSGEESRLSLEAVLFYDRWGNRSPEMHADVRDT